MKTVHVLPDGGELICDSKDRTVEVGDRGVPETVTSRDQEMRRGPPVK